MDEMQELPERDLLRKMLQFLMQYMMGMGAEANVLRAC